MRIGTFRSLTDPKKRYAIFRNTTYSDPFNYGQIKWVCNCPSDNKPCKHLKCLWNYARKDALDLLVDSKFVTLTQRGKRFFEREKEEREFYRGSIDRY